MIRKLPNFTKKTANHFKKIRKISQTSTMSLIRLTKSTRGKDAIIDKNYHKYTLNSTGKNVIYWPVQTEIVRQGFPPVNQQGTLLDNQFLCMIMVISSCSRRLKNMRSLSLTTWPMFQQLPLRQCCSKLVPTSLLPQVQGCLAVHLQLVR